MIMIQQFFGTVKEITKFDNIIIFKLTLDKELEFIPGQFINFIFQDINGRFARAYSIADYHKIGYILELLIEILPDGRASKIIDNWRIGEVVSFKAPFGRYSLDFENINNQNLIFIALGTGIAPHKLMIKTALSYITKNVKVYNFHGVRYDYQNYYESYFNNMIVKNTNFQHSLWITKSDKLNHENIGRVQIGLDKLNYDIFINSQIYICAHKEAVTDLTNYVINRGTKVENIHFERYS